MVKSTSSGGPCGHCGRLSSPCWRKGPPEKPLLCNACGARYLTKQDLTGYSPGTKASQRGGASGKRSKAAKQTKARALPRPEQRSQAVSSTARRRVRLLSDVARMAGELPSQGLYVHTLPNGKTCIDRGTQTIGVHIGQIGWPSASGNEGRRKQVVELKFQALPEEGGGICQVTLPGLGNDNLAVSTLALLHRDSSDEDRSTPETPDTNIFIARKRSRKPFRPTVSTC